MHNSKLSSPNYSSHHLALVWHTDSALNKARYSQWPRGLGRRFAATRLVGLRVRIPPGLWRSLSCECVCCEVEFCETSRSLIHRSPTECGVCLCNLEPSKWGGLGPRRAVVSQEKVSEMVEGEMFSNCFREEDKIKYGYVCVCVWERERNQKGNSKEISVPQISAVNMAISNV